MNHSLSTRRQFYSVSMLPSNVTLVHVPFHNRLLMYWYVGFISFFKCTVKKCTKLFSVEAHNSWWCGNDYILMYFEALYFLIFIHVQYMQVSIFIRAHCYNILARFSSCTKNTHSPSGRISRTLQLLRGVQCTCTLRHTFLVLIFVKHNLHPSTRTTLRCDHPIFLFVLFKDCYVAVM